MSSYQTIEQTLQRTLGLTRRPVAITFCDSAPAGVEQFHGVEPSSCSFWRLASAGRAFYTLASDHYNCPVGAYTHNVPLPAERAGELEATLKLMSDVGYIRMEEVPGIPRLPKTPAAVAYAPLGDATLAPDVVLVWGSAASIMLLNEAAMRAGVAAELQAMSRPTCMALPAALLSGTVASIGCIGNRVYTGATEGELYAAVRGADIATVAAEADTIASANAALTEFHTQRRALATE
jgi:uncharacterized protein (DUF169 family)